MSNREEIFLTRGREQIKMPLIVGDYFTHDITLMRSDIDNSEIVIFHEEYRKVKCGKTGSRKINERHDTISIPFVILDKFIEAIKHLSENKSNINHAT